MHEECFQIKTFYMIFNFFKNPKTKKHKPRKSFKLNLQKSFLRKTTHNLVKTDLDAEVLPQH